MGRLALVAGGFAEVVALVLASGELAVVFAGRDDGVDFYEFVVAPGAGGFFVEL